MVTAQLSSLWAVRHIHLDARHILLLHKNLIVHPDTLVDNAVVPGGSPLRADLMQRRIFITPRPKVLLLTGSFLAPPTALPFWHNIFVAPRAEHVTFFVTTLRHLKSCNIIPHTGARAFPAPIFPGCPNRIDYVVVHTHPVWNAGGGYTATVIGERLGEIPQRAAHCGVPTAAGTLIFITALGLDNGQRPM